MPIIERSPNELSFREEGISNNKVSVVMNTLRETYQDIKIPVDKRKTSIDFVRLLIIGTDVINVFSFMIWSWHPNANIILISLDFYCIYFYNVSRFVKMVACSIPSSDTTCESFLRPSSVKTSMCISAIGEGLRPDHNTTRSYISVTPFLFYNTLEKQLLEI